MICFLRIHPPSNIESVPIGVVVLLVVVLLVVVLLVVVLLVVLVVLLLMVLLLAWPFLPRVMSISTSTDQLL